MGSINADLVLKAARAPEAGETLTGRGFSTGVGGKGLNQCAAVALQSRSKVSMVACVGQDTYGEMCCSAMTNLGIQMDHVRKLDEISTGVAMIIVEDSGNNRILLSPGANEHLSRDDIDKAKPLLESASMVIFQLESPLATVQYAIEQAQSHGVKTLLNPAPAQNLTDEIMRQVSFLIPNESEASLLTQIDVNDVSSAKQAGEKLLDRGVQEAVIITLGSQGCVIVTRINAEHVPANKVKAIDTTAFVLYMSNWRGDG